jgi:drug/metabolite transporter (DMT)-like permease
MKLALGQVPPLVFVLLRLIGSLAVIVPILLAARQPLLPVRGERLGLFWVGQLQVAGFLIFSIIGLAILPAGRAIVLAYTMPLWAIPIGLFLWPEPLGRHQLTGAAVGFAGLVLFMNPGLVDWRSARVLAGNALLLLAALAWARILSLPPALVEIAVLGSDLVAAGGQHRSGRGYSSARSR